MVGKPAATVMTSSPGLSRRSPSLGEVSALTASRLAEEPELTSEAQRTPTKRASFRSNSSAKRPVVNQASRAESTTELTIIGINHLAGDRNRRLPRLEFLSRETPRAKYWARQVENLLPKPCCLVCHRGSTN